METKKLLAQLLYDSKSSIVISTYKANKVITFGSLNGSDIKQVATPLKKPMGIAIHQDNLAIGCLDSIHFFSSKIDATKVNEIKDKGFDKLYLHRAEFNTSILDLHDIHFAKDQLWGINTSFSCLCTFDINYSFIPKWKPNFISRLTPEDRCHLNGLALRNGLPKYATALSKTDVKQGWRNNINESGVLMEIPSGRIIADCLSMPHSPLVIDDELYLLESGIGQLVKVDLETNNKTIIYDFQRFTRGMTYINGTLIIGMSKIRKTSKTFDKLEIRDQADVSGLILFNLQFGQIIGEIDLSDVAEEIYDVKHFSGALMPAIVPDKNNLSLDTITMPKNSFRVKRQEVKKQELKN